MSPARAWTGAAALAWATACSAAGPAGSKADVAADTAAGAIDATPGADIAAIADVPPAADALVQPTADALVDAPRTPAETSKCTIKPTLASLEKDYFGASCAFGSCHSAAKKAGQLVLESGKSYAELVGVAALHPGASGWVRVLPGKPEDSFLFVKVTQPQSGQGKLMPMGVSEPLDADCAVAALKAWIAAGAPP